MKKKILTLMATVIVFAASPALAGLGKDENTDDLKTRMQKLLTEDGPQTYEGTKYKRTVRSGNPFTIDAYRIAGHSEEWRGSLPKGGGSFKPKYNKFWLELPRQLPCNDSDDISPRKNIEVKVEAPL